MNFRLGVPVADIFISYSRDDRQRAAIIARAFEEEGLSVWWDPEIVPGTTYDEVIDRELEAAKCVVVAWSESSRQSRWVREEATDALNLEKLIPVWIEQVALPRGFKLIQTENLVGWTGDRTAEGWQRVMIQANALTGRATLNEPQQGTAGALAAIPAAPTSALSHASVEPRAEGSGIGLVTVLAAVMITAMWFYGSNEKNFLLSSTAAFAALAFLLFRFADADLSPGLKAMARRWFMPVEGKVQISAIEGFNNMFEAVFGQRHWSWKCFWRSAVASTVALTALVAILDYTTDLSSKSTLLAIFDASYLRITMFAVCLLLSNILGDYVSLWETRFFLRMAAARPWLLVPILILDAVLTPAIFAAATAAVVFVVMGLVDYLKIFGNLPSLGWDGLGNFFTLLLASTATAYITSVWLWLALIFTPIARFLLWSRRTGLTFVGRVLDAQRRPFTALGYVMALMILIIGGGAWGVTKALALV
ncbi:MAG: hypothetical protein RLZ98_4 [Pseudomonadota bacterium]|jgi:hypothetical protein